MSEWQPVVGWRCVYEGNDAVVVRYRSGCAAATIATIECAGPWIPVDVSDLTEHPDDARHRRLLEAARDLVNRGYDVKTLARLQSAVQAIDQAEADHA